MYVSNNSLHSSTIQITVINGEVHITDRGNNNLIILNNSLLSSCAKSNEDWNSGKSYTKSLKHHFETITTEWSISIIDTKCADVSYHNRTEHEFLNVQGLDTNS